MTTLYIDLQTGPWLDHKEIKINLSRVFCATHGISESLCGWFGAPYKIRTCDPRFRKPMLYPTELRAQLIYSRYLSQNMSICFLNPIYISRNLSVKRQMSDTRKSGITICNSNDSFFHVKYLVAIDSESQRLAVLSQSASSFRLRQFPDSKYLIWKNFKNLSLNGLVTGIKQQGSGTDSRRN